MNGISRDHAALVTGVLKKRKELKTVSDWNPIGFRFGGLRAAHRKTV